MSRGPFLLQAGPFAGQIKYKVWRARRPRKGRGTSFSGSRRYRGIIAAEKLACDSDCGVDNIND